MTRRPGLPFWVALLLVSVYAVRAAFGLWGGVAYSKGRRLAALAKFERALPLLERSAVGQDRAAALWLTAQVRLGVWHDRLAAQQSPESMREFAPTVGVAFNLIGIHEMMHAAQFVAMRRKLGKPVLI